MATSLACLLSGIGGAPPVEQLIEGSGERAPRLGGFVECTAASIVEPVVLAVGSLVGGNDVRLEHARLVKAAQRSIYGGVPNLFQSALAQAAQHVVAVAVLVGEHREDSEVEDALQQLTR